MSHSDPLKWGMPGWRIEQRFAPGVLIGNWDEDRYKFQKGECKHNSTHKIDFQNYGSSRPDVTIRRKAQLTSEGLGKEFLFYHHGNRYSNNMISWYDEHFNKRERDEANKLPELRKWDSHKLAWVPEKSDHPIEGEATNFGHFANLKKKWGDQIANETHGDFDTTYTTSFLNHGTGAMVDTRHATPKSNSTSLHKFNQVNKNLNLRNGPMLQSPEQLPSL